MAVYTQVDDSTLAAFLSDYTVGAPISFKGIAEGVSNSNFLLETDQSRFILTLYEKINDPEDLPYFLSLMEHLANKGLPSALPISDRNGQFLKEIKGKPACLISFLTGVSIDAIGQNHCASVGQALAKMHLATQDFSGVRENDLSVSGWRTLVEKTRDRADEVMPGLSDIIVSEIEFLEENWPTDLPKGTVHADLFPDNVLFMGTEISGLIDFYFSCTDFMAYDLAVCMNAWCFDQQHHFDPALAKRLMEMYDIVRPLTPAELEAMPILCRGASMRFLLMRLYDWLNPVEGAAVNLKDPLEYLVKLQFHQAIQDTAEYVV
ncbi:homoserine kinase [Kordiimonas sediminis]|uniref:Homoserine kinase n=1 Tax=Kordiimonas sediminis TaxID=1735581 RepID=A0A919E909_9PROT|nr:homoserine kinase [Kordiimonas sediminis]GHF30063.1 homoserine kinase [Kordiimonas sediminis]